VDKALTAKEVAERLGVAPKTVYRIARRIQGGEIEGLKRPMKIGGRYRFTVADVEALEDWLRGEAA
jgi:excisionase family DNA binding protein